VTITNTNLQTDASDDYQSSLAADDEIRDFRQRTWMAAFLFGMPSDLIWVNKVVPEMIAVLDLYMPLADPADRGRLAIAANGLQEIRERKDWDIAHFSWAKTKEPSLHGYYEKNPHYAERL